MCAWVGLGLELGLGLGLGVQSCEPHTEGSNPRRAGRVPGRPCSATHAFAPRPGQTPPSPPRAAARASGSCRCSCCHACAPQVRGGHDPELEHPATLCDPCCSPM
eukprot:scaffold117710_cov21-Phaeocystis_antarctica.AAC.1